MTRKIIAVLLALSLLFAMGCGKTGTPETSGTTAENTEATTTAVTTTVTTTTTTTTSAITETTVQEDYDVDAIRATLEAELAADDTPKKIADCTRYGNYLFIFCDPILREGETEDIFGGWLFRYNLKTGTLERHNNPLPLSRYIILSETRVVGEGGRLTGFEPYMPNLYDLTFTENGPTSHYIEKTYFAVSGGYISWNYTTSACRLLRADADAESFSFLYERTEEVGVGNGIPNASWKISFSDGTMTILFNGMTPGNLSLGDLGLSNVFFESAELKEIDDNIAVVLRLTKYARYFAVEGELIVSPETFQYGQYWYSMMRISFTAGGITSEDVLEWSAPDDCFEDYIQRLAYIDAILVTLPEL